MYRVTTFEEYSDGWGAQIMRRSYLCTDCKLMTYVRWRDLNEMKWQIECTHCQSPSKHTAMKLRPIPLNGVKDSGYFDKALGCYIESASHKDRILKERNLRPVSDGELEKSMSDQVSDALEHEKTLTTFQKVMSETQSFAAASRAITEE